MVLEKRALSIEELEAQTALELPARETPDTVIISCVAVCIGKITIKDVTVTVDVLAQVCAGINAALALLGAVGGQFATVDCTLRQTK